MPTRFDRITVLKLVMSMELGLLAVALVWAWIGHIDLLSILKLDDTKWIFWGIALGLLTSATSLAVARLTKFLSRWIPALGLLDDMVARLLMPIFAETRPLDIFVIAVASGFCEEVFFRGVLQQQFGLVVASIIFGLFHFAGKRFLIYVVWAALAGAVMGISLEFTHCLWVPILAHAANNFLSIMLLHYRIGYEPPDNNEVECE